MKTAAVLPQAAILAAPLPWRSNAREDNAVLNLEPNPGNPRNSEGAFVTLRSGRILFLYTQFYGGQDGWYCYTAIHYAGDAVLLGYCAGDYKVGGLNRLRIRRIDLGWLRRP